jgi:hypothetical protein
MVYWGRRGRDHMVVGFTKSMQSVLVPIITDVVTSNLDQGEVYNIIFVSDLRQVMVFPSNFITKFPELVGIVAVIVW